MVILIDCESQLNTPNRREKRMGGSLLKSADLPFYLEEMVNCRVCGKRIEMICRKWFGGVCSNDCEKRENESKDSEKASG